MTTPPPRLHVIPAMACDKALVLRRGPSGQVLSILWDRASDSFESGQWLKGRIYEHRSDLSPDGRHMVYFAGNGVNWWTVVSRAPWLRALAFYPQNHTWGGGGAFAADGRLWLNGASTTETLPDGLKPAPQDALPHATDGFHMGDAFAATLLMRGWVHVSGTGYEAVLSKGLHGGAKLELSFAVSATQRSIISNRYALVVEDERQAQPDWEWAEPFGQKLQFAKNGGLWEADVARHSSWGGIRLIKDFGDLTFEAIEAPYAGIREEVALR